METQTQGYIIGCAKSELIAAKEYAEKNNYSIVQLKYNERGEYVPNGDYGLSHEPTSVTCFYLTLEEMVNILNKTKDVGDEDNVMLNVAVSPIGNATSIIKDDKLIDVTDYSVW